MKTINILNRLTIMVALLLPSMVLFGQFDDLYYTPIRGGNNNFDNSQTYNYGGNGGFDDSAGYDYDNDEYDHYDDYDYQFSRRIRRFHRPNPGFGFYDPFFYDPFWNPWHNPWAFQPMWIGMPMNPWMRPGLSLCFNRWNRFGGWGVGMGWGSPWGFNSWGNPYMGWGNPYMGWGSPWGMDPFMMGYMHGFNQGNMWGGSGWGGNHNDWGWNNPGNRQNVVYGARRGGSVSSTPRANVRQPNRDQLITREGQAMDANNRQNLSDANARPSGTPRAGAAQQAEAARSQRETGDMRADQRGNNQPNQATDARSNRRFFNVDRENTNEAPARERGSFDNNNNRQQTTPARNQRERSNDRNEQPSRRIQETQRTSPAPRQEAPSRSWDNAPSSRGGGFDSGRGSAPSSPRSSGGGGSSGGSRSSGGGGGGRTSPRG
jgi:hypothetical protein